MSGLVLTVIAAVVLAACPPDDSTKPTYTPGDDRGSVAVAGDLFVGGTVFVDTSSLLGGTSRIEYRFEVEGAEFIYEGPTNAFDTIKDDHGKRIRVGVLRDEWEEDNWLLSDWSAPLVWGWRTRTIAIGVPNDPDNPTNYRRFTGTFDIEVDSDNYLYVYSFVLADELGGDIGEEHNIFRIDPNGIDLTTAQPTGISESTGAVLINTTNWAAAPANTKAKVELFRTNNERAWTARWLAMNPANDDLYGVRIWGRDVYKFTGDDVPGQGYLEVLPDVRNLLGVGTDWTNVNDPENGPGHQALNGGLAVDAEGNMFILDQYGSQLIVSNPGSRIIKGTVDGDAYVLAGNQKGEGTTPPTAGTGGKTVRFADPSGITVGHDGALYVMDGYWNGQMLRVDPVNGTVTTFAGGQYSHWDGPAIGAGFTITGGITYGRDGNYYVVDRVGSGADMGPVIRRISEDANGNWHVSTIAGHPGNAGYIDGLARAEALFSNIKGIAAGADGTVYVVDSAGEGYFNRIRMIYYDNN